MNAVDAWESLRGWGAAQGDSRFRGAVARTPPPHPSVGGTVGVEEGAVADHL